MGWWKEEISLRLTCSDAHRSVGARSNACDSVGSLCLYFFDNSCLVLWRMWILKLTACLGKLAREQAASYWSTPVLAKGDWSLLCHRASSWVSAHSQQTGTDVTNSPRLTGTLRVWDVHDQRGVRSEFLFKSGWSWSARQWGGFVGQFGLQSLLQMDTKVHSQDY